MSKISSLKRLYKAVVPLPARKWILEIPDKFPDQNTVYDNSFTALAVILYALYPLHLRKRIFHRKVVLFYPERPKNLQFTIKRTCWILGWKMSYDPHKPFDLAIHWHDTTHKSTNFSAVSLDVEKVINGKVRTIGKDTVMKVFEEVFGYSYAVDPTTHRGPCVRKSIKNAVHDGTVIQCPIERPQDGFVYQKFVDAYFNEAFVYDIRLPVYRGMIPLAYFRYRSKEVRFDKFVKEDLFLDPRDIFSGEEIAKIREFVERMGLDYVELDIVRDKEDKRIYIVDANDTPCGPRSNRMRKIEYFKAVFRIADTFEKVFMGEGETRPGG